MQVTMTMNGEEITRDIEPRVLLVHFIRDNLAVQTNVIDAASRLGVAAEQIHQEAFEF